MKFRGQFVTNTTEQETINLTPLLSLMMQLVPLVLLSGTFFTVGSISAQLSANGNSNQRLLAASTEPIMIRILKEGHIKIRFKNYPEFQTSSSWPNNLEQIKDYLIKLKNSNPELNLAIVAADESIEWEKVTTLMNAIKIHKGQAPLLNQVTLTTSENF